jgi:hypothetical protein
MIINTRRLLANTARRAVMHAGKKPSRRRHSYARFAVNSVLGTMMARMVFAVLRGR